MPLSDLSKQTVMRRALKPMTEVLQAKRIKYHIGFPFQLSAKHTGKSATFRTLGDLATFLGTFELPQIAISEQPLKSVTPGLPLTTGWKPHSFQHLQISGGMRSPINQTHCARGLDILKVVACEHPVANIF